MESAGSPISPARADYVRGLAFAAAGMILISPDALLIRLVQDAGFWELNFYRSLFMGVSLSLVLALFYRRRTVAVWRAIGWLGVLAGGLMGISNLAFVAAIQNTTTADALVLISTMPLFAAVLARVLIGERLALRTWIAIFVAIGGIAVIFANAMGSGGWVGNLFALAAAALQGLNLVALRRAGARDMAPTVALAGLLAAGVALPFAEPATITARDLGVLALLGGLVLPLSLAIFIRGARYVSAAEVALMALLETVLGPFWVWLALGEVPAPLALMGGAVVVAAIAANAGLAIARRPQGAPAAVP